MFIAKYSVLPLSVFYMSILFLICVLSAVIYQIGVFPKTIITIICTSGFIIGLYKFIDDYLDSIVLEENELKYNLWLGIMNTKSNTIGYDDINNIEVKKGLFGMLFNFGTIIIYTKGNVSIEFKDIDNVEAVKEFIEEKIN